MECLGVPVDHRLRDIIKSTNYRIPNNPERSEHIRILKEFGQKLYLNNDSDHPLTLPELDFGLELARPEVTGGVVVILEHPSPAQEYHNGFSAEELRCKTLATIKELVRCATGGMMDTDSVTILDCMPFMTKNFDRSERQHVESQEVFLEALEAKKPDVVLACFRTKTEDTFIKTLQSEGVGRVTFQPAMSLPKSKHGFLKINVFHPSFAVNYHNTESCFIRLLMLEFTKGFIQWCGDWREQDWMRDLRTKCTGAAAAYREFFAEAIKSPEKKNIPKRYQIRHLLKSFDSVTAILDRFEEFHPSLPAPITAEEIISSELQWAICDTGLALRDEKLRAHSDLSLILLNKHLLRLMAIISSWGQHSGLETNTSQYEPGNYKHEALLCLRSKSSSCTTAELQDLFFTLLRQLNLLITPCDQDYYMKGNINLDVDATPWALLRFSTSLENYLWKTGVYREQNSIIDQLSDLNL